MADVRIAAAHFIMYLVDTDLAGSGGAVIAVDEAHATLLLRGQQAMLLDDPFGAFESRGFGGLELRLGRRDGDAAEHGESNELGPHAHGRAAFVLSS